MRDGALHIICIIPYYLCLPDNELQAKICLLSSQEASWPDPPVNDCQFTSVTQSCLTLCDPMNRSTPGLPVHHQLPEFTQTRIHQVSDAIQPSHPRSSPSSAPNPSQHQSLFQWVNSLHEVAKTGVSALASVLPKKSQGWSPSERTGWISLQSKGLSRVFSNTTLQKHQFFSAQPSSQSNSRPYMTTGKTIALTRQTFVDKVNVSAFEYAV